MYQAVGSYFPNGDDESLLCTLDLSEGSSKHFPKERLSLCRSGFPQMECHQSEKAGGKSK